MDLIWCVEEWDINSFRNQVEIMIRKGYDAWSDVFINQEEVSDQYSQYPTYQYKYTQFFINWEEWEKVKNLRDPLIGELNGQPK